MIGKIQGSLIEILGSEGLVELSTGLSYWVQLPKQFHALSVPTPVSLYTYLQVREDAHVLFGFESLSQYKMFHLLLKVDGVGPKTAHMVTSQLSQDEIVGAVRQQDVTVLTALSGLGKKSAQKIILELSSKLKTEFDLAQMIEKPVDSEAMDALIALGYKKGDAHKMLENVDPASSLQEKIRKALSSN